MFIFADQMHLAPLKKNGINTLPAQHCGGRQQIHNSKKKFSPLSMLCWKEAQSKMFDLPHCFKVDDDNVVMHLYADMFYFRNHFKVW